jgi:hypothetical protein
MILTFLERVSPSTQTTSSKAAKAIRVCFRGDTLSSKHLASHHKCRDKRRNMPERHTATCGERDLQLVLASGATSLFCGTRSVQGSSRSWRLSPQQNPSSQPIATMAGIRNDLDRLKSTNATISDASPFRTACRNIIAACRNSPLSLANYCREGTVPVLASSLIQVRWFAERIAAARFSHIQPACAAVLCDIISASASAEPAWRAHACSFPRSCR